MAQILTFPKRTSYPPLRIRSGDIHSVSIWIVDKRRPKEARWHMQWAIQRAGSFRALKGFKDRLIRRGGSHIFQIGRTDLARRFLIDIADLVEAGRAIVEIDGVAVCTAQRRSA